ncbi:MAG: hypothetical protein SFV51_25845 [Bryobacteraceae bacterium]|nr:hypothetical protein [Bryobacteraceae bacterium]
MSAQDRTNEAVQAGAAPWPRGFPSEELSRPSRCLEHFLAALEGRRGSGVLDLGGASQANITYITALGHRMSSESVLHALDTVWHDDGLSEARKIEDFLEQTLNYQYSTFAGVLIWDTLQFLPPPLLQAAILRLHDILEQDAVMLAYFHADEKQTLVPAYSYRILDGHTIAVNPKAVRQRPQSLNSRAIENLFQNFKTVKFFLTKDHLREVLIVR